MSGLHISLHGIWADGSKGRTSNMGGCVSVTFEFDQCGTICRCEPSLGTEFLHRAYDYNFYNKYSLFSDVALYLTESG